MNMSLAAWYSLRPPAGIIPFRMKPPARPELKRPAVRSGTVLLALLMGCCAGCREKVETGPAAAAPPDGAPVEAATVSQLPGMIPTPRDAWDFTTLSPEDRVELEQLLQAFHQTDDKDRRLDLLERIGEAFPGRELAAFAREVLALGDPDLSLAAVEMLSGNTSADILPALDDALASPSEEVRQAAAAAAGHVTNPKVVDFFGKVFDDPAEDVRLTGMSSLDEQRPAQRLNILDRALKSRHGDVQEMAIGDLQVESTRRSLEILFQALDSAVPEVREEARFVVEFLIEQEFSNASEARAWWSQNRQRFDNDLVPVE